MLNIMNEMNTDRDTLTQAALRCQVFCAAQVNFFSATVSPSLLAPEERYVCSNEHPPTSSLSPGGTTCLQHEDDDSLLQTCRFYEAKKLVVSYAL